MTSRPSHRKQRPRGSSQQWSSSSQTSSWERIDSNHWEMECQRKIWLSLLRWWSQLHISNVTSQHRRGRELRPISWVSFTHTRPRTWWGSPRTRPFNSYSKSSSTPIGLTSFWSPTRLYPGILGSSNKPPVASLICGNTNPINFKFNFGNGRSSSYNLSSKHRKCSSVMSLFASGLRAVAFDDAKISCPWEEGWSRRFYLKSGLVNIHEFLSP